MKPTLPVRRYVYDRDYSRYTHYLFRYPAKFHPPVVRQLIQDYSGEGDTVCDPFCGSGTSLVEALIAGRSAVGMDIDPVAVLVSSVKTHRYRAGHLRSSAERVLHSAGPFERSADEYQRLQSQDISERQAQRERGRLWVPRIPHIEHWFRRYVIVDLARIRNTIARAQVPRSHKEFLRLCFAAIVRASSNADPVPVSGLEVTAHMKKLDEAGRLVNPFALFRAATARNLDAVEEFAEAVDRDSWSHVRWGDATSLRSVIRRPVDVVITSPPYHNAVDYYRRHTLEMYWLGFTKTHSERLALRSQYIGHATVLQGHPFLHEENGLGLRASRWEKRIRKVSDERANSFKHYVVAMQRVCRELHELLKPGAAAVFVVGKSGWNGTRLPTGDLFSELARGYFTLTERLWYPVKNRYMSYKRHNGADISQEQVLVFKRRR